jgi:molybdopterin-guanine dinucleotide biosynthesis protein A
MGGVDKAMVEVGGATMLDRVLAAVAPHCEDVVVVGPSRATMTTEIRFTMEASPGGGPVPAIAAGLAATRGAEVVVVLAVDLPLLAAGDVARLVSGLDDPGIDAVAAADHRGRPNPLLAAYRVAALRQALEGRDAGGAAAELLPPATVTVDLGQAATLNVNDATDLERARQRLRPDP